jgi:hypothetical protein
MSDELPAPEGFSKRIRLNFAWGITAFSVALISYLVWNGESANILHQSALSGAFFTLAGILAGVGFGAIATNITSIFRK